MNDKTDALGRPLLADLPRQERERLEVEKQRELDEGFTRRHVANAEYDRRYLAAQVARVLRMGKREG